MTVPRNFRNSRSAELQLGQTAKAEPELGAPGWYSRGYLPHRDEVGLVQFLTFRLADSLPREKLAQLDEELRLQPDEIRERLRREHIEQWLDAGAGCCALKHPRVAEVVENALRRFDGDRYWLRAWCIMPNHVRVLLEPAVRLAKIVQSWKSFTGRWALAHSAELELGVPGKEFWMREYWDRFVRDERHLRHCINYVHANPVKAGLCATPEAWPWSSASRHRAS